MSDVLSPIDYYVGVMDEELRPLLKDIIDNDRLEDGEGVLVIFRIGEGWDKSSVLETTVNELAGHNWNYICADPKDWDGDAVDSDADDPDPMKMFINALHAETCAKRTPTNVFAQGNAKVKAGDNHRIAFGILGKKEGPIKSIRYIAHQPPNMGLNGDLLLQDGLLVMSRLKKLGALNVLGDDGKFDPKAAPRPIHFKGYGAGGSSDPDIGPGDRAVSDAVIDIRTHVHPKCILDYVTKKIVDNDPGSLNGRLYSKHKQALEKLLTHTLPDDNFEIIDMLETVSRFVSAAAAYSHQTERALMKDMRSEDKHYFAEISYNTPLEGSTIIHRMYSDLKGNPFTGDQGQQEALVEIRAWFQAMSALNEENCVKKLMKSDQNSLFQGDDVTLPIAARLRTYAEHVEEKEITSSVHELGRQKNEKKRTLDALKIELDACVIRLEDQKKEIVNTQATAEEQKEIDSIKLSITTLSSSTSLSEDDVLLLDHLNAEKQKLEADIVQRSVRATLPIITCGEINAVVKTQMAQEKPCYVIANHNLVYVSPNGKRTVLGSLSSEQLDFFLNRVKDERGMLQPFNLDKDADKGVVDHIQSAFPLHPEQPAAIQKYLAIQADMHKALQEYSKEEESYIKLISRYLEPTTLKDCNTQLLKAIADSVEQYDIYSDGVRPFQVTGSGAFFFGHGDKSAVQRYGVGIVEMENALLHQLIHHATRMDIPVEQVFITKTAADPYEIPDGLNARLNSYVDEASLSLEDYVDLYVWFRSGQKFTPDDMPNSLFWHEMQDLCKEQPAFKGHFFNCNPLGDEIKIINPVCKEIGTDVVREIAEGIAFKWKKEDKNSNIEQDLVRRAQFIQSQSKDNIDKEVLNTFFKDFLEYMGYANGNGTYKLYSRLTGSLKHLDDYDPLLYKSTNTAMLACHAANFIDTGHDSLNIPEANRRITFAQKLSEELSEFKDFLLTLYPSYEAIGKHKSLDSFKHMANMMRTLCECLATPNVKKNAKDFSDFYAQAKAQVEAIFPMKSDPRLQTALGCCLVICEILVWLLFKIITLGCYDFETKNTKSVNRWRMFNDVATQNEKNNLKTYVSRLDDLNAVAESITASSTL